MGALAEELLVNAHKIREDFPILNVVVKGKPLVYLDNAATTQKPRAVIDAITQYYSEYNANIHRAVHTLAEQATARYEGARLKVARLINARSPSEVVFVRGTTEAINLVRYAWALPRLNDGDEIVSSVMEHHSNIVPWQSLRTRGITVKYVDIDDRGTLNVEQYSSLVTRRTKLVTVTHVSNVLGTVNPVRDIGKVAHENGALFLLDAAQSVPHMPVDVQAIDCDFMAFSGHKMLGPTGVGVLYGRRELLEEMEPFNYGGDMIKEVHLTEIRYNDLPWKFEAGTSNIADVIGLGAAVDYLNNIGLENIRNYEEALTSYALDELSAIRGLTIYGPRDVKARGAVISFNLGDIHAHDLASILDEEGIAIRSGHHCAMPLMERLKIPASSRASLYIYNLKEEIDTLTSALEKAARVFKL